MDNKTKTRVSVIIPHYNTPDLLEKLLASIPRNPEIQVIVVDDNSDREREKLVSCMDSNRDRNLLFLRNTTGGNSAGACRNIGLDYALGDWILFADADDYFTPGFYSKLELFFDTAYDLVYFSPTSQILDTQEKDTRHKNYEKLVWEYSKEPSLRNELFLKYDYPVPWSKLYRRVFLETYDIRFDHTLVSNDVMFSLKCSHLCNSFQVSREVIYCVTRSSGTLTMAISKENHLIRTLVKISRYHYLRQHLSEEYKKIYGLTGGSASSLLEAMVNGYGIKTVCSYVCLFRKNDVPLLYWSMFNPFKVATTLYNKLHMKFVNRRFISK